MKSRVVKSQIWYEITLHIDFMLFFHDLIEPGFSRGSTRPSVFDLWVRLGPALGGADLTFCVCVSVSVSIKMRVRLNRNQSKSAGFEGGGYDEKRRAHLGT